MSPLEGSLFEPELPEGFLYRPNFIDVQEEAALADHVGRVEFGTFEMRGVAARRRVAFFGRAYDAGRSDTPPIPPFLMPLRAQLAGLARVEPAAFAMALINEYQPGAPIGWHRDAPQYDLVAGISLGSSSRMMLRPYTPPAELRATPGRRRTATHELVLQPRSAYVMSGPARTSYEHHIPAVSALRYSITFRTLR